MKAAVRYYSRTGNTKALAEAIANAAETHAISVDLAEAALHEKTEVLFIGGALYAYGIDRNLKEYLDELKKDTVGQAVIFSTSWISKHAVSLIKANLERKGIPVAEPFFYVRNKPDEKQLKEAQSFAKKIFIMTVLSKNTKRKNTM